MLHRRGTIQVRVMVAIIFTFAVGVGMFVYFARTQKPVIKNNNNTATVNLLNINIDQFTQNTSVPIKPVEEKTAVRDNCVDLVKNLESCTAYRCAYFYNKESRELISEIIGLSGDNCKYKEETRNIGMKIDCEFAPGTRQAVADFYSDLKLFDPQNTTGEPIMQNVRIYHVGGNAVQDPVMEALLNGECKLYK